MCFGVSVLWLLVAASSARAQLPTAQLMSVFPPGGKAGTTFDVTLSGRDIDDAGQLVFTQPGITAVQKIGPENPFFKSCLPLAGQFTVTIPADATPGIYEVRTIGRFGASNPRGFVVGALDEVADKDPAATAATARVVPLEATVSGAVRPERSDFFKFTAHKGQRVLIDCWAQRIDSRLDATLVLYDAKNHELARGRQRVRRDPLLDVTAPADGDYVLKVYDFLYKGGNEYFYRLTFSTKPYLDFIMPPAGQRGTTEKFTLFGRNLPSSTPSGLTAADGKPLDKLEVEIALPADSAAATPQPSRLVDPTEAAVEAFSYRLPPPLGPSVNTVDVFCANAPICTRARAKRHACPSPEDFASVRDRRPVQSCAAIRIGSPLMPRRARSIGSRFFHSGLGCRPIRICSYSGPSKAAMARRPTTT